MTFLELQNRTMARVNYSSSDARTLVKNFLNERYRNLQSSVNLAATRRAIATANTAVSQATITVSAAKVIGVYDAVILRRPLREVTATQLQNLAVTGAHESTPTHYAIFDQDEDNVTLLLYPTPAAVSELTIDTLQNGTDMSADSDEPSFPADFHDALIYGAMADVYFKLEKQAMADRQEKAYDKRVADLRYFLQKSAFLNRSPRDMSDGVRSRRVWPYSNLA